MLRRVLKAIMLFLGLQKDSGIHIWQNAKCILLATV